MQTGDKRGAGTDADVFIVFVGSEGESGKENANFLSLHMRC